MEKNNKFFVLHRIKLRVPMDAQVWSFFVVLPSTLGSRSWPIPQIRVMHHLAVYMACLMREKKTWIPLFLLVRAKILLVKSQSLRWNPVKSIPPGPPLAPRASGSAGSSCQKLCKCERHIMRLDSPTFLLAELSQALLDDVKSGKNAEGKVGKAMDFPSKL